MAGDQLKVPRQPKLRSSCDACGAAKLKCDREKPECRRCISNGLICVYSVSRKMGKPPKDRQLQSIRQPPSLEPDTMDMVEFDSKSESGIMTDPGLFLRAMDDGNALLDLPSLNFGEWALTDHGDNHPEQSLHFDPPSTPETLGMGGYSSSGNASSTDFNHFDLRSEIHSHLQRPSVASGFRQHDCLQQANEILVNLTGVNLIKDGSTPPNGATSVPLDHMLRLNREASDQLGRLLLCPCAKRPTMILLHASSIARVLVWYEQAAACTLSASRSPAPPAPNCASRQVSEAGLTMWSSMSSTNNSMFDTSCGKDTPNSTHSEMSMAPAKVAIGTFNTDDLRVHIALKVQLLLGEMRRAAGLIDQFVASHGTDNQRLGDGVDSLYQTLDSWLRNEHSRIADMMRLKLRELDT